MFFLRVFAGLLIAATAHAAEPNKGEALGVPVAPPVITDEISDKALEEAIAKTFAIKELEAPKPVAASQPQVPPPAPEKLAKSEKVEKNDKAEKGEKEIPVFSKKAVKAESAGMTPFQRLLLGLGVVFTLLGGLAFAGQKWFKARPAGGKGKTNQIKVLAQHYLGPKRSLVLVRVAGESMLLGVTDQNVNLIKSLSLLDDEVPDLTPKNFQNALNEATNKTVKHTPAPESDEADWLDEFAIKGVKDIVTDRLKGMRKFE